MLMQNWDSSAVCRAGETAYTLGSVPPTNRSRLDEPKADSGDAVIINSR